MNKNSKIGILGAGVEGAALAQFLLEHGFTDVVIFDEKMNDDELIVGEKKVKVVNGADAFNKAASGEYAREVVFRSPGIHINKLNDLRDAGVKVTSTTQYFFENCPGRMIGVTGTKGKGTTSTLIYMMLKEAGLDAYLGGNIGESPLTFFDKVTRYSWVVLELSSFQLHDLTISPHVAVVLRVTCDHMDYHKDVDEYVEAKTAIVRYQKPEDYCVVNADYDYIERFLPLTSAKKLMVSRFGHVENGAFLSQADAGEIVFCRDGGKCEEIDAVGNVALLGAHNLENILPAVTVAKVVGVPKEGICKVIETFSGLPHRLEFVREVDGVKYYNDSFSTTPETSVSATYAFKGPVILIAGGSEKFLDYTEWGKELQKNPNLKAVFVTGATAERMEKSLKEAKEGQEFPLKIYRLPTIKDALAEARKIAIRGDNIVMSPATASFDQFKNYKERGAKFKEWVGQMEEI